MIDAEQTYIQASIGYLILLFQAVYNKEKCVVHNTYQCYRKVSFGLDIVLISRSDFKNLWRNSKLEISSFLDITLNLLYSQESSTS